LASRIAASGPVPHSDAPRAAADGTRRSEDEEHIVIDGIEREAWEVLTQDQVNAHKAAVRHLTGSASKEQHLVFTRGGLCPDSGEACPLYLAPQDSSRSGSICLCGIVFDVYTQLQELEERIKRLQTEHFLCQSMNKRKELPVTIESSRSGCLQGGSEKSAGCGAEHEEERQSGAVGYIRAWWVLTECGV